MDTIHRANRPVRSLRRASKVTLSFFSHAAGLLRPRGHRAQASTFAVVLALSWTASGCFTAMGAGIGAVVDARVAGPYEDAPPASLRTVPPGEPVRLDLRDGRSMWGRYRGRFGPTSTDPKSYALLDDGDAVALVPTSEVNRVGLEVTGPGWKVGAVIGAVVDFACIAAVQVAQPDWFGTGGRTPQGSGGW